MTSYYFDSVNGLDTNDGLTTSTPKQSYDAYAQGAMTAGDTYYFKRGTTQVVSTLNTQVKAGSSTTARTKYKAYGVAQVPYSIWTPPPTGTLNNSYILNASGRSYIDFEDMYFDGLTRATYPLYMFASAATQNSGHKLSRCFFTNMASGQAGMIFGGTATSTGDTADYVFEDCEFFNNPGHGLIVNGAHGIKVRRCKFYGNGFNAPFGGHGFSSKFRVTDATTGWTNTGGTIWQRTMAANELDVYYVKTAVSGYQRLAKNTSTPTTPGIGQYGVDTGVLYINLNSASNPSGQSINYAWGRCYDMLIEDCESYGNISDPAAAFREGHGFAFDAYAELSIFRRNKSYNNQGVGFSVNLGDGNIVENNVAYGNQACAMIGASCWNTTVRHNTFYDNNVGPNPYSAEIIFLTYANNGVITNNILKGTKTYGIDVDTTCAGFSGSNNNVYGYGAIDRSGAYTGTITVDPILDAEHRATAATVKRGGIYLGGRDFYGKYHTNPPSIGAVSDHPTPGWAAAGRKAA